MELSNNHPREWRFDVIDGHTENQDIVFRGCYHVYGDVWVANAWNSIRMFRILINQYTRVSMIWIGRQLASSLKGDAIWCSAILGALQFSQFLFRDETTERMLTFST